MIEEGGQGNLCLFLCIAPEALIAVIMALRVRMDCHVSRRKGVQDSGFRRADNVMSLNQRQAGA